MSHVLRCRRHWGGLTGNHAAYLLARAGLKVAILEEHPEVGRPWFCTGIVGRQGFDRLNFPAEFIQQELHSASFFSPSGKRLRVARQETQAYVLNRSQFDLYLAEMALKAGAEIFCSTKCSGIEVHQGYVLIKATERGNCHALKAQVCLLATGVNYTLPHCPDAYPQDFTEFLQKSSRLCSATIAQRDKLLGELKKFGLHPSSFD